MPTRLTYCFVVALEQLPATPMFAATETPNAGTRCVLTALR